MAFPDTPVTLVSRLKESNGDARWHEDWRKFVKDYQGALEKSVYGAFAKRGWYHVDSLLVEEIVADVVVSFLKRQTETPYDPEKGNLRSFLSQVVQWRVVDFIRRHSARAVHERLDVHADHVGEEQSAAQGIDARDVQKWEEEEDLAHQRAILAMLIDDVRERVSPRAFAIFDAVKLQHRSPEEAAKEFQVNRHVVDNSIYKVINKLRELAQTPDYRKEIAP
jgi:RNA polymerase sigma-70 factor (ECF subfamily)